MSSLYVFGFNSINKITTALLAVVILSACKENLSIQSGNSGPDILVPIISVPSQSPFYSQSGNLSIQGICKNNSLILLSGSSTDQVNCVNSQFSFNVSQASDGVYNFSISQNDDGTLSVPASLVWNKKTSVSQPSLTYPTANPHGSSESVLNIQGGCESGSTISLGLDGAGSTTCVNSLFSISLPKFVDGDYNIQVLQTDLAGNSASHTFLWNKKSLAVIPNDPQVIVGTSEVFNITGGTAPYSIVLLENNSLSATYNTGNNTYTAGTLSGVTDVLQITDSQGYSRTVNIQVLADVPDHFEFPTVSGNNQSEYVGLSFSEPISIRVVDKYGNGVSNYPVLFQRTAGDVMLIGAMERRTDSSGKATISVIQGYKAARSFVSVRPLLGTLPDIAGSGLPKARFLLFSQTLNNASFDLNFTVGNGAENSIITDLNGDGFPDALVLNKGEPSISRFIGKGNGLFTKLTKLTGLCSGTSGMATADFNNSGHQDLVISCNGIGQYAFFAGIGDGNFNPAVNYSIDPLESLPVDIAVGDFNADGYKDIAMALAATNNVSVRFGNNNGTFGPVAVYDVGSSPSKLAVGDLNNDNKDDIVVINAADDSISILLNNGNGTFAPEVTYGTGSGPSAITLADLNSDGYKDVIVANNLEDNISVFLNLNDGTLDLGINTGVGLGPIGLVAKDLNADGIMDLAVSNIGDSTVSILFGLNIGTFDVQPSLVALMNPININADDFNADGVKDLFVVSNGESKVQIIPGQSNGVMGFITEVSGNPLKVISADLDGDGFLDKAVVNQSTNSITLHKGNGKGLFTPMGSLSVGNGPTDAVFDDLNKDGVLDIVVVLNAVNSIRVFMGQGNGVFTAGGNFPVQSQPTSIVSGDFNVDGLIDVAVVCSGANQMNFLAGNGDGTFQTRATFVTEAQPSHLTTGDFNEDYILDIAVVNQSADSVTVFLSNGNGTFQSGNFDVESGPNGIVSGFFDSDGFLDLAVSNNLSSSVSILKGKGDGTFNAAVNFYAGVEPVSLTKGDLNGNSREDLIVGNGINLGFTILFGSPTGNYVSYVTVPTGMNSSAVAVDDLNNDKSLDITILDDSNSIMKVFLGQ
jgi:hypothetical protein